MSGDPMAGQSIGRMLRDYKELDDLEHAAAIVRRAALEPALSPIKSQPIDDQVQAAIREATMTGVGIMRGGEHIPASDIYQPNHIDWGKEQSTTVIRQHIEDMQQQYRKRDDDLVFEHFENIRFVVSEPLAPDVFRPKVALGKEAQKLAPSKLILDLMAAARDSFVLLPKDKPQKRSLDELPHVKVFLPSGQARWLAAYQGFKSYGPTPTAALRSLEAMVKMKDKAKAGSC